MAKAFTEHPDFWTASNIANHALEMAMKHFAVSSLPEHTAKFDVRLNAIVDDLTRLLLAMGDEKSRKDAA